MANPEARKRIERANWPTSTMALRPGQSKIKLGFQLINKRSKAMYTSPDLADTEPAYTRGDYSYRDHLQKDADHFDDVKIAIVPEESERIKRPMGRLHDRTSK